MCFAFNLMHDLRSMNVTASLESIYQGHSLSVQCYEFFFTQYSFCNSYVTNFTFILLFRTVLIIHDNGLVKNLKPNLKRFNKLYWIIVSSFLLIFHTIFPISLMITGQFPNSTMTGKILPPA